MMSAEHITYKGKYSEQHLKFKGSANKFQIRNSFKTKKIHNRKPFGYQFKDKLSTGHMMFYNFILLNLSRRRNIFIPHVTNREFVSRCCHADSPKTVVIFFFVPGSYVSF